MSTYRVGVVSDTHVPEFQPALHKALFHRLAGVDLVLHAGDITEQSTLDSLSAIAPVVAVRGNHDAFDIPLQRVVDCGGINIGLIHGHRGRIREFPGVAWNEAVAGRLFWWNGVKQHVLRAFEGQEVDAVVFGHIHRPLLERRTWGNTWVRALQRREVHLGEPGEGPFLRFSPGATYHCTGEEARRRLARGGPPHHRLYYRSRLRWDAGIATVGLFTIRGRTITPEILPLEPFER